ncbi:MAG: prepilin-type N-terminal cleavage/methylation domain-containing protein [Akkermansiaceae bacterium]|nr:prepilin-type N-terminal cleavage/methylation domain-containing protein [Akkermansiaceae bacterium]
MARRGFTMVEVMIVVAIIVVLVAVGYPVTRGVLERAHRTQCLGKLREIGVGLDLYLADHGDRFPEIAMAGSAPGEELTLEGVLREYVAGPDVFHCPADRKLFKQTGSSYLWNSTQSGRHKLRTSFFGVEGRPEQVPLVTDKEAFHGDPNGVNMLYADYHLTNKVEFRAGPR